MAISTNTARQMIYALDRQIKALNAQAKEFSEAGDYGCMFFEADAEQLQKVKQLLLTGTTAGPEDTLTIDLVATEPQKFNGNINAAGILLDRALGEIEGGFVRCEHCGEQEDTKDLDFVDDLKAARTEILAFIGGS